MKSFYREIALIFLFAISSNAQENCVQINTGNVLLNLEVGMTVDEVNKKVGSFKIRIKSDEDFRFFQSYVDKKPPNNLSGVRAVYLRFFEKKLYQIEVFYDEHRYPSDINRFAEIISSTLNLTTASWKFANRQAVYRCRDKSLTIDYQLNPRFEVTDETIKKIVDEKNQKTKLF